MVNIKVTCVVVITCGLMVSLSQAVTCSYTPQYRYCDCSNMGGVTSEDRDLIQVYCTNQPNLTEIPDALPSTLGRFYATAAKIHTLTISSLAKFPRLKELGLLRCQLKHIQNGTFSKQQNLQELMLGENKVNLLYIETFTGLKFLRHLTLQKNLVAILTREVFKHLQSLVYLDISDNLISVIEDGAFKGLNFLKNLILSGHKLRKFGPDTFGRLPSLYKLDASFGTNLRVVDDKCFVGTPVLKLLHLNDNALNYLPMFSFRVISGLEELDLSTNNLRFIPSDAFEGMKSLQTLFLNSANLSYIQNGSINELSTLKKLYLHDNPFSCDCNLRWLLEWLNSSDKRDFKLESPSKMKCAYPTKLNGSVFLRQNSSDFQCSCEACQRNIRCSGFTNLTCNCFNGNMTDSCDVTCQSNDSSNHMRCVSADDRCYCNQRLEIPTCHRNAVLVVSKNRKYSCICNEGYTGNGLECNDIDECQLLRNRCYRNSTECINTNGSYYCSCRPGFVIQAADVNNCQIVSINITVLVIKSTVVNVSWKPKINNANCKLIYTEIGVEGLEILWQQTNQIDCSLGSYTLEGLKPNTIYRVKLVLLTNSSENEVDLVSKTFITREFFSGVSGSTDKLSSGSIAAIVLVCILLPIFLVIGACYIWYRRKSHLHHNSLARLASPSQEITHGVRYVPGNIQLVSDLTENNQQLTTSSEVPTTILDEWEIPRERLVIGSKIGEGEFGLILEGTLQDAHDDVAVAVKTLKDDATRFDYKDMLAELKVFKKVGRHPNVVSLIGACTSLIGPLYIVTEFVGGGDLLSYLRASRRHQKSVYINIDPPVSEKDLIRIASDVAKGMRHISQSDLVHRDLAARNVLMAEDGTAKVCDFGLTRSLYTDGIYVKKTGGRLPFKWMAPESIADFEFTSKSDVWSYGVLLWEMATFGGFPYPEIPPSLLVSKLRSGYRLQKPIHCSDDLYGLMSSCWKFDPESRPSFEEICGILENMLSDTSAGYVNLDMDRMFEYAEFEPRNIQDS